MSIAPSSLDSPLYPTANQAQSKSWHVKLDNAFRGLKRGIRGHASFFVHLFFAALAAVAAFVLRCTSGEWCILLLCIGMVLVAELFNSALEALIQGLDPDTRKRINPCLEIATGAVLMASLTAVAVGLIVFVNRLLESPV